MYEMEDPLQVIEIINDADTLDNGDGDGETRL